MESQVLVVLLDFNVFLGLALILLRCQICVNESVCNFLGRQWSVYIFFVFSAFDLLTLPALDTLSVWLEVAK